VADVSALTAIGLSLVATQAILLPFIVVVREFVIYNSIRQLLFAIPALSIFAVGGFWWLGGAAG